MHDLHVEAVLVGVAPGEVLGDRHRPVPAARAADRHGEVRLALGDVLGHEEVQQGVQALAVTFSSFGFKHGPVRDADLAFDVRFLPNPHYVDELRPLTGRDPRVAEYVAQDGKLAEFYERLHALLDFLLPQYVAEGKAHLTVAVGCTGGRHRSVAIAEHLAERYRGQEGLIVDVIHRDTHLSPNEAYRPQ